MFLQRQNEFRDCRRALKAAIKEDSAERDPWGSAYRTVCKKLSRNKQASPSDPTEVISIISDLFPRMEDHISVVAGDHIDPIAVPIEEVSADELIAASRGMGSMHTMLQSPGKWDAISNFVALVMVELRTAERTRKAELNVV
ncbi:hypothetical protein ACLKA6_001626 [Drosophila palustris]